MSDHLFAYGTLRRCAGHAMHRALAREAELVGTGRIEGRLHDLGEYPGAAKAGGEGGTVVGEVYRLHDPARTLPVLDAYEGCGPNDAEPHGFTRSLEAVALDDGRYVAAWVYWYRGSLDGKAPIPSGDYLEGERGA